MINPKKSVRADLVQACRRNIWDALTRRQALPFNKLRANEYVTRVIKTNLVLPVDLIFEETQRGFSKKM